MPRLPPQDQDRPPEPAMDAFRVDRTYLGAHHGRNERRAWLAAGICAVTFLVQILGGLAFNSIALLAGGVHMAAHVAALTIAGLAYLLARRYAKDGRFAFGTGKIGYLAAFTNAVALAITAAVLAGESVMRLTQPETADFHGATPVAVSVLAINLLCMWLLRPAEAPQEAAEDGDLNLSAAHLHLAADVAVSVLTIAGLLAGEHLGWTWADPLAGALGAVLVARFAWGLARRSGAVLLDMSPNPRLAAEIGARLEAAGGHVADLHLWRLGPGHHAAIAVVRDAAGRPAAHYRTALADLPGLSHVTLEVRPEAPHRDREIPADALTRKSASV